jgi:acetylornithine deacetylase/succinyl-diaminopimelate desuccinylase-like protein
MLQSELSRQENPMSRSSLRALSLCAALFFSAVHPVIAQIPQQPDWSRIQAETMQHFQALLRFDTSDPPGNEKPAADYLKQVLEREGIPVEIVALEPNRPNVIARLKGNGSKRPLLIMAHTDVVNTDPAKWVHPAFSATRIDGYVYGRGAVDDKDNVVAGLMMMLMLKRMSVPLDRDVIFLAEAGEEGATRVGIQLMTREHRPKIDAEYCLAEGGNVTRMGGQAKFATVQTLEKIPRGIELTATGPAGHGSVPLAGNAIVHLSAAVAKIGASRQPIKLNETTRAYFQRLATISTPVEAARYLAVIGADAAKATAADNELYRLEPRHSSMLRTSVSPNIIAGGYRSNVIPSEAKATLDVRMVPGEDTTALLASLRRIIDDPAVTVAFSGSASRPQTGIQRLDSEAFKAIETAVTRHYSTVTLPTMSTGATDMAFLRALGMQCYGIGPAIDFEDAVKGFGAHSDQERIIEAELHRFVRFKWDVVEQLARAKRVP